MSGQRYVIVQQDDAGLCRSVNEASITAATEGIVTSTAVMAPCPGFEQYIKEAKKEGVEMIVHATVNAEWPEYKWGPVSNRRKKFTDAYHNMVKSKWTGARRFSFDDVFYELGAQIVKIQNEGINPPAMNPHMTTLFLNYKLTEAYLQSADMANIVPALPKLDSPLVQAAIEKTKRHDLKYRLSSAVSNLFGRIPGLKKTKFATFPHLLRILEEREAQGHFMLDEYVLGVKPWFEHKDRLEGYKRAFSNLPEGFSLFTVHCGYNNKELRDIMSDAGRRAERCESDLHIMCSDEIKQHVEQEGIQLVTWREAIDLFYATRNAQPALRKRVERKHRPKPKQEA